MKWLLTNEKLAVSPHSQSHDVMSQLTGNYTCGRPILTTPRFDVTADNTSLVVNPHSPRCDVTVDNISVVVSLHSQPYYLMWLSTNATPVVNPHSQSHDVKWLLTHTVLAVNTNLLSVHTHNIMM